MLDEALDFQTGDGEEWVRRSSSCLLSRERDVYHAGRFLGFLVDIVCCLTINRQQRLVDCSLIFQWWLLIP